MNKRQPIPQRTDRSGRALAALARLERLEEDERRASIEEQRRDVRALEERVAEIERRRRRVVRDGSGDVLANRKLAETLYLVGARIRRELAAHAGELDASVKAFREARGRRSVIDRLAERRVRAAERSRRRRVEQDENESAAGFPPWRRHRAARPWEGERS